MRRPKAPRAPAADAPKRPAESFVLLPAGGRHRLWRVEHRIRGRAVGWWTCDSREIALELLRRVRSGRAPGWVARDLRKKP